MSASERRIGTIFAWLAVVGLAQPALGHPGHVGGEFVDGWLHPFFGLDHLLAMVAVGLLAVRLGGRALWIVPGCFLGGMLLGGLLGAAGLPCPYVETGIMASVLVLGLLVAASRAVPLAAGVAVVVLFAVMHGHSHAAEMAAGGSLAAYAAGFLLATAALHAAGIGAGELLVRGFHTQAIRALGGAIAAAGLLLCLGWV